MTIHSPLSPVPRRPLRSHRHKPRRPRNLPLAQGAVKPWPRTAPDRWCASPPAIGAGTVVTVAPGDSVETIAKRYGVPASAIMQANNIAAPATLHPGQHLVIPRHTPTRLATAAAPRPAAPTSAVPATNAAGNQNVHVVAAGDTLSKISHRYHKSINEIAKANNVEPTATLN